MAKASVKQEEEEALKSKQPLMLQKRRREKRQATQTTKNTSNIHVRTHHFQHPWRRTGSISRSNFSRTKFIITYRTHPTQIKVQGAIHLGICYFGKWNTKNHSICRDGLIGMNDLRDPMWGIMWMLQNIAVAVLPSGPPAKIQPTINPGEPNAWVVGTTVRDCKNYVIGYVRQKEN